MAEHFDDDLHIVENSGIDPQLLAALAFPDDLAIISDLDDEPNDVGGLTAAELKAKFDEAGLTIQKYINEKLVPEVLTADATETARAQAEEARAAAEALRVSETEGVVARATEEADRAERHADAAQEATRHTPYVGDNGNWMVWSAEQRGYQDTGVKAQGPIGPQGIPGVMTELGRGMFAMAVSEDGHLLVAVNETESAPPLEINAQGHLVYKINE